jgi:hypothetical protein
MIKVIKSAHRTQSRDLLPDPGEASLFLATVAQCDLLFYFLFCRFANCFCCFFLTFVNLWEQERNSTVGHSLLWSFQNWLRVVMFGFHQRLGKPKAIFLCLCSHTQHFTNDTTYVRVFHTHQAINSLMDNNWMYLNEFNSDRLPGGGVRSDD